LKPGEQNAGPVGLAALGWQVLAPAKAFLGGKDFPIKARTHGFLVSSAGGAHNRARAFFR